MNFYFVNSQNTFSSSLFGSLNQQSLPLTSSSAGPSIFGGQTSSVFGGSNKSLVSSVFASQAGNTSSSTLAASQMSENGKPVSTPVTCTSSVSGSASTTTTTLAVSSASTFGQQSSALSKTGLVGQGLTTATPVYNLFGQIAASAATSSSPEQAVSATAVSSLFGQTGSATSSSGL